MNTNDQLDCLESLTTATVNIQQQITKVIENVERLTQLVNQDRERTNSMLARQDAIIASINTELERRGRILDYLLRCNKQGNGNNPE